MAKHTCSICGAEVGLVSEHKLADGNYICRKVCGKKCFKLFDKVAATLEDVNAHIAQIEFGTKAWNQIFVPLLKTKVKDEKLKKFGNGDSQIVVSPSTGLVALTENRYKFMMFGKTTFACVYRLADLYDYDYEEEKQKNSEGKEETKSFARLVFRNTTGLYNVRIHVSGPRSFEDMEKYLNTLFGIQKTLRNSLNNAKRQMNAIKSAVDAVKAAKDGTLDEAQAADTMEAVDASVYGDRTEWIAKADAALATVQ